MSKHTPGPWEHCTAGYPKPDVRAVSGRAVAHTWMVCSGSPKTAEAYKARCAEDRANARLIAAAPELLEALHNLVEEQNANEGYATAATYDKARAAIAKATGEPS